MPRIYFGGASDAAERIAAEHVDVYLAWGEPPAMVAERVDAHARRSPRPPAGTLDFGIRFHVIARPTADEAWAAADALRARMERRRDRGRAGRLRDDAVGRPAAHGRRCTAATRDGLVVYPNVWAGIGLVRGGVGTALVGSYEEVADRIVEYHELGFDEFILSGYPHLEEAYWFGEGVMPRAARPRAARRRSTAPTRPGLLVPMSAIDAR